MLKNILNEIPVKTEIEEGSDSERQRVTTDANLKDVIIGSVNGKPIEARYDPINRIFYPKFES